MRYIQVGGEVIPKHCKYGPRPAEGVVFNPWEWCSITDHLIKDQREREIAAAYVAREEAKKEISFDMTRNWSNTLASIKTQGNQKRLEKVEREKQDKIDQYHQILKSRIEEKKGILADVRKTIFQNTDPIRIINSAVWFSTALEGRKPQIELKNKLKEEAVKKDQELGLKYKKDAEEFNREKCQAFCKEKAKKKLQKKFLDEQTEDLKRRKEEADDTAAILQDAINMKIEGEKIHHCNMIEKEYKKEFAAKFMRKTENHIEYERKLALEQEEEDDINEIYLKYDKRFKKERKEREERMKNEAVERRIKISEMLAQKLTEAALKEESSFASAVREKEEEAQRVEESKKQKQAEALASLLEGKRVAEERKAKKEYEEKEQKKWEMMQSYRRLEVYEEWKQMDKQHKKETLEKVKAGYDCQCKQRAEKREQDLKEWLAPLEDENADREEIRQYCEDTLKFVREHKLPEHPVLVAISKVKKLYRINDEEKEEVEKKKQKEAEKQECNARKTRPLGTGCYCLKY